MKLYKTNSIQVYFLIITFTILFALFHGVVQAEDSQVKQSPQKRMLERNNAPMRPIIKNCPDLKVKLNAATSDSGLVILNGTVTNIGYADFNTPAEIKIIMNVSYPPKTYNQVGISKKLCQTTLTRLKKGAFFPLNCRFQIPDFDKWVIDGGRVKGSAKRLFTIVAVKKDQSIFTSGEDCVSNNNSAFVEINYLKKLN